MGVDKITKNGVVVDGTEYELDCLIFATGFEVGTAYTRRSGYEVIGKNDLKLSDKWKDGPQTFHGMFSHGFPNCYFLGVIQSALTTNFVHLLMEQTKHIAHVVKYGGDHNTKLVEPTLEAEEEWVALIKRNAHRGERFFAECTPGYYNNEGNHDKSNGFLSNAYGKDIMNKWGYKNGIIYGLLLSCLGAITMYPAVQGASPGDSNVFYYVLGALFIVGLGFSLQQTAANPFAISLGETEKGAHRLNLAGGINSLGTTIGPIVVALILFGSTPKSGSELNEMINNGSISLSTIQMLYLSVGGLFLAAAALFYFSKRLPQAKDDSEFLKAPKALSALPVSYTHLTLPTILLV